MDERKERGDASHLDGLRAWLGEVDRDLRVRSRAGLALLAIAVGLAGVALHVAIEASRQSAPAGEVKRLQGQVDALRREVAQSARLSRRLAITRSLALISDAEVANLAAQVRKFRQGAAVASPSHSKATGAAASAAPAKKPAPGSNSSVNTTTVSVADNSKLGKVLVDSQGRTLYDFQKDKGGKSACYGACAKIWPPLAATGTPQGTDGAKTSKLSTSRRSDGTAQATYAGHPLYSYAGDTKPGDTSGNGITEFGGSWHALHPNGKEAGG